MLLSKPFNVEKRVGLRKIVCGSVTSRVFDHPLCCMRLTGLSASVQRETGRHCIVSNMSRSQPRDSSSKIFDGLRGPSIVKLRSKLALPCSERRETEHRPSEEAPHSPPRSSSPQPHTTNHALPAQDRASPEYSIYNEKRRGRPHVSKSIPGYHSQNALASNKPNHHKDISQHLPEHRGFMRASMSAPTAGEAQGFSPTEMLCSGGPLDSPGRTGSST